ncbi:MAG: cysteine hydrolase [Alphaproteobacteria bacterium]|nr:cysteine hydrolase [Alphaproteobacteria bacterium]
MWRARQNDVIDQHIVPAIAAARTVGLPIIYSNNSAPRIAIHHSQLGRIARRSFELEWEQWGQEANVDPLEYALGEPDALRFPTRLEPEEGDYFVRKHSYSGFFETRLDGLLRNLGIKTLVCIGFSLDVCLHSTMVDAMSLNYEVVLVRDATLAQELPEDLDELRFTKRLIVLAEYSLGVSTTSAAFVAACKVAAGT